MAVDAHQFAQNSALLNSCSMTASHLPLPGEETTRYMFPSRELVTRPPSFCFWKFPRHLLSFLFQCACLLAFPSRTEVHHTRTCIVGSRLIYSRGGIWDCVLQMPSTFKFCFRLLSLSCRLSWICAMVGLSAVSTAVWRVLDLSGDLVELWALKQCLHCSVCQQLLLIQQQKL